MRRNTNKRRFRLYAAAVIFLGAGLCLKGGTPTAGPEANAVPGEIVIYWDRAISADEAAKRLAAVNPGLSIEEHIDNYTLAGLQDGSVQDYADTLKKEEGVAAAEPNYFLDAFSVTNDEYSDTQWALDNNGAYTRISGTSRGTMNSTPDVDMDIPEAWLLYKQINPRPSKVIVAVIDTGVDYKHPDLKNHMWVNPGEIPDDGIDNDGNGYVDDIYGWDYYNNDNTVCHYEYNSLLKIYAGSPEDDDDHGTHVAGIIAAEQNNRKGIAGIASNFDVDIMSLKIHGGTGQRGTVSNAVKAVKYAQMMGAKVCNMSWGSSLYSETLEAAMRDSSMLFVCAAGNSGADNDKTPMYPANFELDNVISVTFLDANGFLTRDSNYGKESVDLAAPGSDIYSTLVGTYGTLSGSSMAAPHVTGLAAILYSLDEGLYPQTVKELILSSLKPLSDLDGYVAYPGIPSALLALNDRDLLMTDTSAPVLEFETAYDKASLNVLLNPTDKGFSGIRTIRYSIGKKKADTFSRGTAGLQIEDNLLSLNKAGDYTFYISDYAGNESVYTYKVEDDTIPPEITADYSVSKDYKNITVKLKISDEQSGVKQGKYLPGEMQISDFRSSKDGLPLTITNAGTASFTVTEPGVYTIYAVDYRGNKSVITVNAVIKKAEKIEVTPSKKTMKKGETDTLLPVLYPAESTDAVSFKSSSPDVATVNTQGKVTALKAGKTTITITAASGKKTKCVITVVS